MNFFPQPPCIVTLTCGHSLPRDGLIGSIGQYDCPVDGIQEITDYRYLPSVNRVGEHQDHIHAGESTFQFQGKAIDFAGDTRVIIGDDGPEKVVPAKDFRFTMRTATSEEAKHPTVPS